MKFIVYSFFMMVLFASCVKSNPPKSFDPGVWTWGVGQDGVNMLVNGVQWSCDTNSVAYIEQGGWKYITATASPSLFSIRARDFTPGMVYPLIASDTNSSAVFVPILSGASYSSWYGNKGELKIIDNDSVHITGLFYFNSYEAISGTTTDITKGYFNVKK